MVVAERVDDMSLTDKEIIRALTDCVEALCDCQVCPFNRMHRDEFENCVDVALEQALSLINRQKAEVTETRRDLLNEIYALEHQLETAKAEAIKEVAEALDAEVESSNKYIREYDDSNVQVAYNQGLKNALKIVKEMAGESDV